MFSKIVWCYVLILTLLDISPNTYLSAQGKSHDNINIHDTLVEGVTFQEWGSAESGGGAGEGGGGGEGPVRLVPAALRLGRVPLAAPRAALVTLVNRGNTTLHLASVAGTTPDFHASFFHSKTVPPDGNTTFSVVFLGRREGPVAAHLYIHTSLGVHKYPVSAEGAANECEVWPLLGLRVPLNATLAPLLALTNPTDTTIQVREVYSSGGWVALQLPGGGGAARAAAWRVPPRARRPLVRLRLAPPPHPHATAYIRIKANVSLCGGEGEGGGGGGGGLVVAVEAARAPAGPHAHPPHVRLRARGSLDPHDTVAISLGNSAEQAVAVRGALWGARCLPAPHQPPPPPAQPPPPPPAPAPAARLANGGPHAAEAAGAAGAGGAESAAGGARLVLRRGELPPRRAPAGADATLTLHYDKMWAEYSSGIANGDSHAADGNGAPAAAAGAGAGAEGAWCAGWVRLGAAALPYSVRLLPGTLELHPPTIDIITAQRAAARRGVAVRARNRFALPLLVTRVELPPGAARFLQVEARAGVTLAPGERATLARVRLRAGVLADSAPAALRASLAVHTNVSTYALPLRLYSGLLQLEWEWPNSADGRLRVGAVGTSATRRVRALLRNRAPAGVPLTRARAALPGATLAVPRCAGCLPHRDCHCLICAGCAVEAWLTLVAGARAGGARGAVWLRTPHGSSAHAVSLAAHAGRVAALPPRLPPAAPYAWATAELAVESSMALRMRVTRLAAAPGAPRDPALAFLAGERAEFGAGRWAVGRLQYAPERACAPHCYTGLPPESPETAAWAARAGAARGAGAAAAEALAADAALAARRLQLFRRARAHANLTLHLHTTQVVAIEVSASVAMTWPRLAARGGADARLVGAGGAAPLRLPLRNPSASHALLLQPALLARPPLLPPQLNEEGETAFCQKEKCVFSDTAFSLKSWRPLRGEAREWGGGGEGAGAGAAGGPGGMLLLAPAAEIELELEFAPRDALPLTAYLYLRNNLTVLESVQLAGQGAFPSFRLGERAPGEPEPIALEVTECSGRAERSLVVRNTGRVPLRLRDWRVGGAACGARGFRLRPCAPLLLPPNGTRALALAFAADWTLARAAAALSARCDTRRHEFALLAHVPPRVRAACAPRAPRPPFERALRSAARLLALAALALALALAALDAERLLRRARAPRPAPRAPLDLRALAAPPRPAPAPPRAPPPPPRRRRARKLDPLAESRAFERWRASLRRADDDSDRSSEEGDDARPARRRAASAGSDAPSPGERSPPPPDEPPHSSGDDDATSTGSDASTGSSRSSRSPAEPDDAEPPPSAERERGPAEERPHSPPRAARDPPGPGPPPPADTGEERGARRAEPSPRRAEPAARTRPPPPKHHARKERSAKRRERAPPGLRASPPGCGGCGGAAGGAGDARPVSGGVRAGASWSSVVARREPAAPAPAPAPARPAPPPPHPPPPAADNSLFYFNGEAARAALPERDFAWRADPPPPDYAHAPRDYLGGGGGGGGESGSFGSIGPMLWGDSLAARAPGALWPWGYQPPVRPPPGFGAGAGVVATAAGGAVPGGAAAGARGPVRAFDPFHSLASIWSRGALDWRGEDERPRPHD